MPTFSVIVPAFNVEGYLRQAVMSVADAPDTEVIVVDDRSTDGTSALADELARLYPSVRTIRPESNVGLGRARNFGLAHATGDYVLFLDGDDYFAPGAVARIADVVSDAAPDVVVFGYKRLYPNGDAVEGMLHAPLQYEGQFTVRDNLEILDVLNVAWNKAYRREFLAALGIEFPVGYYEDIPWTYPILAAAQSIVTADEPLYLYRQRWSGSILRSTDVRHLEIVDQFERLMDVVERLEIDDVLQGEIYTRGFRNLVTLATTKISRIPAAHRREFYGRARAVVKARVPRGYELPGEGDKWKLMRAVWDMDYDAFQSRARKRGVLRKAKGVVGKARRFARRLVKAPLQGRWTYRYFRRFAAVDANLVMFENLWGLTPRLNCAALDSELRRTYPHMRAVWAVRAEDAADVPDGFDVVVKGSRDYSRIVATAKYFFVDTNLPAWWRKRAGQVMTQTHHGTPLKLMGVEERGKTKGWKDALLRRCQHWDYSVVSNSYSAEVWKHSYPVRCETLEYGYARNDVLVNATAETVHEARDRVGVSGAGRVVLFAPTFRDKGMALAGTDMVRAVADTLPSGDVLLIRGHYFSDSAGQDGLPANVVDVSNYLRVEDLYLAADVLVTDYSSVMFDFANLRRPIVIFAPDWSDYQESRGTYFDITVDAPGPVASQAQELADILVRESYLSPQSVAQRERFSDIFCSFETGHAAQSLLAKVIEGRDAEVTRRTDLPSLTTWHMDRLA